MKSTLAVTVVLSYFLLLWIISRFTSRNTGKETFFSADNKSNWILVSFGMIGVSLSGLTFISVPGEVGNSQFTYLQIVMGYTAGIFAISFILLPLYYRLKLVSIYTFLEQRFGKVSHKTGALFFIVSQTLTAAFKLFLMTKVLQLAFFDAFGIPFEVSVLITLVLIWLYTYRAGIKTIIITDTLQTAFLLIAALATILILLKDLDLSMGQFFSAVLTDSRATVFEWGWASDRNFFKLFFTGMFLVIIMNGLDQSIMQKHLTCPSIKDAKKNMLWFGGSLLFVNLLFLGLGLLLYLYSDKHALPIPTQTDDLYPIIALNHLGVFTGIIFLIGIAAAAYSSADTALTGLTTSFCIDLLDMGTTGKPISTKTRTLIHLGFALLVFIVIVIFNALNNDSMINSFLKYVGFTYGPLLGLFAFGMITKKPVKDRLVPLVTILSLLISILLYVKSELWFGYKFGFEILLLNSALTIFGLWLISRKTRLAVPVLSLFVLALISTACSADSKGPNNTPKPNIILISTDQQNINMMSAMGNPLLSTPNMDKLAANGCMFTQSYCTSPVCGPARSSIITGRMPHETGVEWNGQTPHLEIPNAGEIFREAGYNTIWAGKWHLPESYPGVGGAKSDETRGFERLPFGDQSKSNWMQWMLGVETDPDLSTAVVGFLQNYKKKEPFFLGISYHNPHDICFYPRKDGWLTHKDSLLEIRDFDLKYPLPDVISMHPDSFPDLPPLPANFAYPDDEPEFILEKRKNHTLYGMETRLANLEFSEKEWRGYLNAYCRLTEMVDQEIGKVLASLEQQDYADNTIIIFTSDHGDGATSHKWAVKNSLYEESAKVPMIICWPDHIPQNKIDNKHLVSQIDILPTLCDYLEIETDAQFTGASMRDIIHNEEAQWRKYLVVELADYRPDHSRKGRMLRTEQYKYNIFSEGKRNEQLFDLSADPGEMNNLAQNPEFHDVKASHIQYLKQWMSECSDSLTFYNWNE